MRKMLFCLLSTCCFSGLFAAPSPAASNLIGQKEVMAACAVSFLCKHPDQPLTINNLLADKPTLARTVSGIIAATDNLSLHTNEQQLIHLLAPEDCPVPTSPKVKRKKIMIAPADCPVKNTPPPSPKNKRSKIGPDPVEIASGKINRLHRQWKNRWSSDGDLQAMVDQSIHHNDSPVRKRATSSSH